MIAEVALNVPLRRVFDYRVPEAPAGSAAPLEAGARVIVPFGTRLRGGIVVALKERSELPEARLKAVQHVTAGPPLFGPELLAFARWTADYYLCGWGEVLEAALPSGMGVKIRTWYRLAQSGADEAGRAGAPRAASAATTAAQAEGWERLSAPVRALLARLPEWDAAQWERLATPEDQAWLRRQLRPGGAVALRQEYAGTRAKARLEAWLRLAHPSLPVETEEPTLRRRSNPLRETKRERILRLLAAEGEVPMARLKAVLGAPGAALRQLKTQGRVVEFRRAAPLRSAFGPAPAAQPFLTLNPEQQAAADALREALAAREYRGFLLQGVTGSGKTEVYLHAVRETLAQGRTCLILVPEIALTAEMVNRFRSRFGRRAAQLERAGGGGGGAAGAADTASGGGASGEALGSGSADASDTARGGSANAADRARGGIGGVADWARGEVVAVLHSGLGEGERFDEWNRIRRGEARIVIGARSAVFAPLERLGLVVVDEEHDGSYKQDEAPRYHGRDAAIWRASRAGAVLLLGTATPSLEAVRNVALGKLTRLRLPERVESRPLPPVELVDLRTAPRQTGSAFFSLALTEALRETLAREEQAILFLNRRGFASLVRCGACKAPVLCANCSLALTWHEAERRLRCHRCDYSRPLPEACPACGAAELKALGLGTERIAQELAILFPEARVLRVDSDSLKRRGELERVMGGIRARAYDLIIGTQILSKGHDFPYITLVGAVLADVSLNLPDFRAPERTFQLLTQIAGRAGRGERPGRVLIQTYNAQHYALQHVLTHDPDAFAAQELAVREAARVPPFASQLLLWASHPAERSARRLAERLGERLHVAAGAEVDVLGPAEAPIKRLAGRWRWMVLLRGPRMGPLQRAARRVLDDPDFRLGPDERVAVDVDPYSVL